MSEFIFNLCKWGRSNFAVPECHLNYFELSFYSEIIGHRSFVKNVCIIRTSGIKIWQFLVAHWRQKSKRKKPKKTNSQIIIFLKRKIVLEFNFELIFRFLARRNQIFFNFFKKKRCLTPRFSSFWYSAMRTSYQPLVVRLVSGAGMFGGLAAETKMKAIVGPTECLR